MLAATGVLGVVLAVHGWSAGHVPTFLGSRAGARGPSATAPPTSPTSTTTPRVASSVGPTLRSQSFAPYAYAVWPGPPGPSARAAQAGLTITVRRQGTGVSVVAGVIGQQQSPPTYYPHGARVYVIEASFGDDSSNTDYNLGDDGLVVTDAQGRIVT